VRIPTIIKPAVGLLKTPLPAGSIIEQMVEEVDIYPSLVDLHGFDVPAVLEGNSWVSLLQSNTTAGKQRVFSQYPHFLSYNASRHGFAQVRHTMSTSALLLDTTVTANHPCKHSSPILMCRPRP